MDPPRAYSALVGRPMQAGRRQGEDLHARLRHADHMLELRGQAAITGDRSPAVVEDLHLGPAGVHHRLDGEEHSRLQHGPLASPAEVQHFGGSWKRRPIPWPQKSRTTEKRCRSTKTWMAWPTSPRVAPGFTASTPRIIES